MYTQILTNKRSSNPPAWNPQWKNVSLSVPNLNNLFLKEMDCANGYNQFHLCFLNGTNRIFHTLRNAQDNWTSVLDVQSLPSIGNIGTFTDISCAANVENLLYVCAVKTDGKIVVLFRSGSGSWLIKSLDLCASASSPQLVFTRVSCALESAGHLHICGLTNTGQVYYVRMNENSTYSTMLNVSTVSPYSVSFTDVSCALGRTPNIDLHICGITAAKIYHTIRFSNSNWQPGFGDVENATNSNLNGYNRITIGNESNGRMHLCVSMSNARVYHTYRDTNGGWQPFFGDVGTVSGGITNIMNVACDAWNDKLDVVCTKMIF